MTIYKEEERKKNVSLQKKQEKEKVWKRAGSGRDCVRIGEEGAEKRSMDKERDSTKRRGQEGKAKRKNERRGQDREGSGLEKEGKGAGPGKTSGRQLIFPGICCSRQNPTLSQLEFLSKTSLSLSLTLTFKDYKTVIAATCLVYYIFIISFRYLGLLSNLTSRSTSPLYREQSHPIFLLEHTFCFLIPPTHYFCFSTKQNL